MENLPYAGQMKMMMITAAAFAATLSLFAAVVLTATDPNDLAVLQEFRKGLENGELLKWPANGGDPCGSPRWPYVFCSGNRVTQIQAKGLGLKGPLPRSLNQLSMLQNLGLQRNHLSGELPSFSGLSQLQFAYLDYNNFDSIPSDFFRGLISLESLALDHNALLNSSSSWSLPADLQGSARLKNLSLISCNLGGPLPEFLGKMSSLEVLKLSLNRLTGGIPETLGGSLLTTLWLNEQSGSGMTGPIDIVASMLSLTTLWLHGNHFSGKIPDKIGDLVSLQDLNLNGNDLVGLIPASLANMRALNRLDLNNNKFMGPVPKFRFNATYSSNPFCLQPDPIPGALCAPAVMALLEFLDGVNYPARLVASWSGNTPCSWLGVGCDPAGKIINLNLPNWNLSGVLSPSISALDSLSHVYLQSNNLSGPIPSDWTSLKSLTLLDLSGNNLSGDVPKFSNKVNLFLQGNLLLGHSNGTPPLHVPQSSSMSNDGFGDGKGTSYNYKLVVIIASLAAIALLICFVIILISVYFRKKKRRRKDDQLAPSSLVVHPRDPSDADNNTVKIAIADNGAASMITTGSAASVNSGESHIVEAGNLIISVQVLRNVTKNFAPENELGRGGFGAVYKGELNDGTKIAVKRMEAGVMSSKALDEFQSEITVLSKVRHRHLVSLLGYSIEGNERILVYEYMPQGALSKHLFHWNKFQLEPLSWKRRLNIALDVARGMEYLHTLAHQSFIHRDLKSSNILLGDDFRAKVSDFGLVKLAPDGERSVVTRLAGTFGYLAPEYAVMGKITTKADVFSFGVVLMELLTGMTALDEERVEERQYLASWFWSIKSDKEKLMGAVDLSLDREEEMFEKMVGVVAELAGHCTAREPSQRPEMGHAVNVLASLAEKWRPVDDDGEECCGIDYSLPLDQMVKDWQQAEEKDSSCCFVDLDDSKGSIPARPAGFADSFASTDGR
ncbi:receptor protein kinase TMK1-like [Andrographis paniculata]|uniref:receptor protein kinase TMK1-like n=1 Tax=Andrographis paniculata TaxID=175694 RepID=UPI0021E7E509|nr:receptor protein kinase TMK1-like [Andrographis paniculata]